MPSKVPTIFTAADSFFSIDVELVDDSNDASGERGKAPTHTEPAPRHIRNLNNVPTYSEYDPNSEVVEILKVSNRYSESSIQQLILAIFKATFRG